MSESLQTTYEWRMIPWRKLEVAVFKLEKRIYKASQVGDVKKVHRLTVNYTSRQNHLLRYIILMETTKTTSLLTWQSFTVTVTIRYTVDEERSPNGMVLMTGARSTEEPCVLKGTRTVLKTSGRGDSLAEFYQWGREWGVSTSKLMV